MGCDGGTIPKRDELVRKKKKPEEKDKHAEAMAKWRYCALCCQLLRMPIVACPLGRLYNKEAIIKYLLDKEVTNEVVEHIRGLRDVKELNLTVKPGFEEKPIEGGVAPDTYDSPYICPVTTLEMNGKYKFCFIWSCGCVLSERALKEVKSETCHKCGKSFSEDDVLIINGSDEEVEQQRKRMEDKRLLEKNGKKSKKRKNGEETAVESTSTTNTTNGTSSSSNTKNVTKIAKTSDQSCSKTKLSVNCLIPEKASTSYSIAKDENTSEIYKSLFTSHESAKKRVTGPWITLNPQYN
ncbi:replication termination factor 2 [Brevipalpus obovatus]|uniref:replication termination factor 2 n=1 Tax=Brevipalpus obovatus TaxID=246614 RepID=UPI003D9E2E3F